MPCCETSQAIFEENKEAKEGEPISVKEGAVPELGKGEDEEDYAVEIKAEQFATTPFEASKEDRIVDVVSFFILYLTIYID